MADHVSEADLDTTAGITALWQFLSDGIALFCIAHRCALCTWNCKVCEEQNLHGTKMLFWIGSLILCSISVFHHEPVAPRFVPACASTVCSPVPTELSWICKNQKLLAGIGKAFTARSLIVLQPAKQGWNRFKHGRCNRLFPGIGGFHPPFSKFMCRLCSVVFLLQKMNFGGCYWTHAFVLSCVPACNVLMNCFQFTLL